MIDRSNGVDKGVGRRAGLVSQYIRGWRGWGAGCLLYIKSPRVITKINRTVKKQFTQKWRKEPKTRCHRGQNTDGRTMAGS